MGISLRHYVLSLVANFLMLLLGLLIGVGLSSEPGLQQRIDRLEARFDLLWTENVALREKVETQEEFERALLPTAVRGRLQGDVIPMVVTVRPTSDSDANRAALELTEALQAAGARVPYRLTCSDEFAERAMALYGGDPASASEKAAAAIGRLVAQSDVKGLQNLRRQKLVRLRGELDESRPTAIVILGGAATPEQAAAHTIDTPLVEALLANGMQRVVACEATPPISYIGAYREFEISTVDNVDVVRGQISAIMALAGRTGNYGDQSSARDRFPEIK